MEYTWFDLFCLGAVSGFTVWAASWVYFRHQARKHESASVDAIEGLAAMHKEEIERLTTHYELEMKYEREGRAALLEDRNENWMPKPDFELYRRDHRRFVRVRGNSR